MQSSFINRLQCDIYFCTTVHHFMSNSRNMNKEDILFRSANKSLYCKVLYTPFCKTKFCPIKILILNMNLQFISFLIGTFLQLCVTIELLRHNVFFSQPTYLFNYSFFRTLIKENGYPITTSLVIIV